MPLLNSQNDCSLSFWWSKIGHNVLTVTAQVNFYVNAFLTYSNPTQLKLHTTPVDSQIPSLVSRKNILSTFVDKLHTNDLCHTGINSSSTVKNVWLNFNTSALLYATISHAE